MRTFKITTFLMMATLFFASCSSDDNPPVNQPKGDYENGFFVTNEGQFNTGVGTITFVGDDGKVSQNIYKTVNDEDLGNVVQSMTLAGDNAYIVVNNSNKIVVANRYTFKKVGVISDDISNPRYMVAENDRAFVSNWGDASDPSDDFISVVNLTTNKVINTISVGEGPEKMLVVNNKLFVNLKGGWGHNDKVAVIDLLTQTLTENVTVGDVPNSLVDDGRGNVWVLCGGISWPDASKTAGKLVKISSGTGSVIKEYSFDSSDDHPNFLNFEDGKLYYSLNGKVYRMSTSSTDLPEESVSGLDGFFYSMTIYYGDMYATDAKDYNSEGELKIFNIASGALLETIGTGIIPGSVVFQQ